MARWGTNDRRCCGFQVPDQKHSFTACFTATCGGLRFRWNAERGGPSR